MFSQAVTIFYIPAIKVQGSGFPIVITAHIPVSFIVVYNSSHPSGCEACLPWP